MSQDCLFVNIVLIHLSFLFPRDGRLRRLYNGVLQWNRRHVHPLLGEGGNLHRPNRLPSHFHRRRTWQWNPRSHLRQTPQHEECAQHVHPEPGSGRPPHHRHVCPLHFHPLHHRVLALWRLCLQAVRGHQGRVHRSVCLHTHCTQC